MGDKGQPLFTDVCSTDLLGFAFAGRSYKDQLDEAIAKTQVRGREEGRAGGKDAVHRKGHVICSS